MSQWIIYKKRPDRYKDSHRRKTHTFYNGAANNRRSNNGKHHLENRKNEIRYGLIPGPWLSTEIIQTKPFEISDNSSDITAERQRIAYKHPHDGSHSHA